MKSILSLAAWVVCSAFVFSLTDQARAATPQLDDKAAGVATEVFLAGYLKAEGTNNDWIAQSKLVTPEFKAAFKKAMSAKEIAVDPVLYAQDVPSSPFKAQSSKVKGDTASVVVTAKYGDKPYSLKVALVAKDGHWLVSKTAPAK